jgi:hypothetical protein
MDWKKFTETRPHNNEEVLVWFNEKGREKGMPDLMTYSHKKDDPNGYWSCESDGEIFYPDLWCRIIPPDAKA